MKIFDYNESNKNNDLNLNQSTNLFSKSLNSFAELNVLSLNKDAQKALSLIYGKYNVFWYSKSMQNYFKLLRILILSSNLNTIDAINCVFSSKKCGKKLAFQCSNFTLYNIKKTFKILELPFYNRIYFKILHFNHNQFYKSSTVYFKVKTQFQIPTFDQKEQKILKYLPNNTNEERQIRCRLIKGCTKKFVKKYYQNNLNQQTKINPNKCIIFHVHGGGFVISSPDSHEIYLRKWVTKLNGIPILSVDYKLSSSYPAAIQDILDLYLQLFLINENENNIEKRKYFTDLFGFVSSNVILVGDSCGGNLILSLLCCLNDIKLNYSKLLSQTKLILPFAIVPIYPVFDLRAVTSPSRFIGSLDPILHSTILMTMHGCYGGMFEKKNKFDPKFKWYLSEENKNNQNKFLDKNVKKMYEKMNSRFNTPYSSPLIYKHINNLNIVSLHLIVSQICPLLDDAIEMYKLWTGEKKIYSFSDLPHGFIQFSDLSSECKKATNDIAFTINSLIDDYFSKINQNKN